MKALCLAAGLGTRLRPITDRIAKPAVPFLNVPLMTYSAALLKAAGVSELVFNTHYLADQIEATARRALGREFPLAFSHETPAPLGSGGGIFKARDGLIGEGTFLVANGDEVILPEEIDLMPRFLDEHQRSNALATILVMDHPAVGSQFGGVWAKMDGTVIGFGKDPLLFPSAKKGWHYVGVLALSERVFNYMTEGESNIFYDVLKAAIGAGETVRVCSAKLTWFETGNPHDFLRASGAALRLRIEGQSEGARFLKRITESHWSKGTILKSEDSQGQKLWTLADSSARIESSAQIKGFVICGENTLIEPGALIENCVLLPDSRARAGQVVCDQILVG